MLCANQSRQKFAKAHSKSWVMRPRTKTSSGIEMSYRQAYTLLKQQLHCKKSIHSIGKETIKPWVSSKYCFELITMRSTAEIELKPKLLQYISWTEWMVGLQRFGIYNVYTRSLMHFKFSVKYFKYFIARDMYSSSFASGLLKKSSIL